MAARLDAPAPPLDSIVDDDAVRGGQPGPDLDQLSAADHGVPEGVVAVGDVQRGRTAKIDLLQRDARQANAADLAPGEPDCGQPRPRRTEDRTAAQPWARRQLTGSVRQDSFTDLTRRQVEQSPPVGLFGIVGAHHNPVAVDVQLDVVAIAVSRQLDERAAEQLS